MKERNRIATEKRERQRIQAGYGDFEADDRDQTVGHIIPWKVMGRSRPNSHTGLVLVCSKPYPIPRVSLWST